MSISPTLQTLKGFRDFLPAEKRLRDLVADKIKQTFQKFGFEPLETPTLEYAELLLGKYGAEADKLVYTFSDRGDRQVGLRYDQTVPTARVLAQYQHLLPKYFRRYQIQNVFRADKPQKGRYREFTQCDADIFGSQAALADAEILACVFEIFQNVGLTEAVIAINDRQSLFAVLSPFATSLVSISSIIQSIDKLDKVSPETVIAELIAKGLETTAATSVIAELGKAAISDNLSDIVQKTISLGVPAEKLKFTPSLARGLDYYTGMIFEINLAESEFGSLGGGGRYDHLISQLGGPDIPAVGFGLGFDRIVEAVKAKNLGTENTLATQVLVTIFDAALTQPALIAARVLRATGLRTEIFPSPDKLSKQFKYADTKQIPWAIIIGETEASQNQVSLKNLKTGAQTSLTLEAAVSQITQSSI
ncbi:MAG TPA: histidine--tRNA ligase [Candidatus Pacebacteria bacterium]|nr:histidine--tRNA ligase [Candidatus Paceibacterota bacterium]